MGILAPLYLAGLAALSLPLILHLVRRTPRGRQMFSSLMFLTPSPPRLTRRSRIDQILLLLMRLAALALLALAFARPFLREAATLATSDLPQRRVAIVIDASASMRRADLWQQAIGAAQKELDELAPHDDVALFTFTDQVQTVLDFDAATGQASATRADVLRQELKKLRPTWATGDLGSALTAIAGELAADGDAQQSAAEPQIVLISDFQKGSRIEALQAFEWPQRVRVVTRHLKPKRPSNAYAHLLPSEEDAADPRPRVRVVNATDSSADQFFVRWGHDKSAGKGPAGDGAESAVHVPAGQSRVVRLARPAEALFADRLVLRGDEHDFDNICNVVPLKKQEVRLLYAGTDGADDPQGMQYYLRLAVADDPVRQVDVIVLDGDDSKALLGPLPPQLVIATRALSAALAGELKQYVERGGTLLLAPRDGEAAKSLPLFLDGVELSEEKPVSEGEFALLGEIDFTHELFAPLASPRYSDFTKIHFWRHWALTVPELKALTSGQGDGQVTPTTGRGFVVVARFDNGDAAILEQSIGKGRVLALTSNWQPDDSQLALSSKFVPIVGGLLDLACGKQALAGGFLVDSSVPLPESKSPLTIRKPDGREVKLPAAASAFTDTSEPGVYEVRGAEEALRFAVNVAAAESNTAPLELEQLEQLGVRMGADLTRAERLSQIRQQRDTELEGRQKVWRWLLVGVLGLLVLETWWAGRAATQMDAQKSEPAETAG